jgi:hypothetical protein
MFVGDPAAGWRLAVGERQQHDPLDSAEAIPDSLVGVAGFGEREVDGGCCDVLGLAGLVEQVVNVVGEQDRALRVSAGEREQLVDRTACIQTVSSVERVHRTSLYGFAGQSGCAADARLPLLRVATVRLDRGDVRGIIALRLVRIGHGELADRPVERVPGTEVCRDRGGIA